MAENIFQSFRLSLIQDVLPVGIGIINRVKKKGIHGIMDSFSSVDEALHDLRKEGEPFAQSWRDQLDKIHPGFGNPAVSVKVEVDQPISSPEGSDYDSLVLVLNRISERLELLNDHLDRI